MEINQIYSLTNSAVQEILGETAVLNEDLSNLVDIGTEVFNANAVDAYVKSLVNHIGRVIFVNRVYAGSAPSVLRDSWEYGSVCQKISSRMPEATENESWMLEDGQTYDPNVFYKPDVTSKFFNKRVTFEVPRSFTEMQVKQSFSNAEQLNAFLSMLYNEVDKAMTVRTDALIMRTINNFIAETVYADYGANPLSDSSGIKAVNLLYLYNQKFGTSLTADAWNSDPDFIRFASYIISVYVSRMRKMSTLFNIGGEERFTPTDMLHIVMLSDFKRAADVYLQSGVYHNELTRLPDSEDVPYWQGSGNEYSFTDVSKIDVKTSSGNTVQAGGVLCAMFDRDALGVSCFNRRVTSNYNPKAEFYSNWYKMDAGYWNDFNEQFVVFFVA